MFRSLALGLGFFGLLFGACDVGDGAYRLSEAEGGAVVRAAFEARGLNVNDTTHVVTGVSFCPGVRPCASTLDYVLDGWDAGAGVGFEYVSRDDPDFVDDSAWTSGPVAEVSVAVDALEEATDAAVAPARVLVFRPWAHETRLLAEEQLRRQVEAELDALDL